MAREKALRDLLLGRETLTHLPGIADDLGGLDRKLLLLLLHTKEGIDHLEQYAITNMMAELLPEGGLLGDTSVSRMSACWWMPVCMTNSPRLWSGFVMNLRGFAPGC